MKRNSGSNDQDRQRASDENLRDGSPAGPSKAGSLDDLESWSREDFEAALPLYVGGELDAQEAARVDAWLIAHPEDQETFAASEQAAGVLARYAEFTKERETPDLWAGIRSELIQSGTLENAPLEHAAAQGSRTNTHERPILGGPRWFQRKSVAAAAALLLTGSVGLFLMSRGAATAPNGAAAPAHSAIASSSGSGSAAVGSLGDAVADASSDIASLPGEAVLSGERGTAANPLDSRPVGNTRVGVPSRIRRGKSQRLQLAQQGAERLIDDAPKSLLWQSNPWVETSQGLVRSQDGAQLTGGR